MHLITAQVLDCFICVGKLLKLAIKVLVLIEHAFCSRRPFELLQAPDPRPRLHRSSAASAVDGPGDAQLPPDPRYARVGFLLPQCEADLLPCMPS